MIHGDILHPDLLRELASCGHKSQILIADANYACVTNAPSAARRIYLNFSPGMIASTFILEKILRCINVEQALSMSWPDDFNNTIDSEYQALLPESVKIEYVQRQAFYDKVRAPETQLVIASGETRRFANILLTVAPIL